MAGLYLHIPFCKQACHYCDFHFSTNQSDRSALVTGIVKELQIRKDYLGIEKLTTIYFGGGTPSLLSAGELESVFDAIYSTYTIIDPEVTLEANPDDLTPDKLKELRELGINRLSIGIQAFDNAVLKFLNRVHDARGALRCVEDARTAGFENISIDLIYAIPGQDQHLWEANLDQALALAPEHLSAYALTIEEKTAFGKWQKQGTLSPTEENESANQFEWLIDRTTAAGYEHYEISNFCKPGFHSRHNSNYWKQEKYLGVGPSAHSYDGESRQFNVPNNSAYLKSIAAGNLPFEREILTTENKINEYIFTTLRTVWGCDFARLRQDFGVDLYASNHHYLDELQEKKLVQIENQIVRLTRSGKLVADKIAADLFVVARVDS